ncbi:MAG: hypothetical protein WC303_00035 [Candidatus Paceibacterota bacterium]|jgi:hypothetical protein
MQDILNTISQSLIANTSNLLLAGIIFFIGWLIAIKIKNITIEILNKIHFNQMTKTLGWQEFFDRYHTNLNIPKFFGTIIEIFFVLLFFTVFLDTINITQLNGFLMSIINYFPNILISILIFIFAVFLSDFSKKVVLVSLEKEKITYSGILGNIISYSAWILAILAILYQLQIVPTLILTIFIGFVALIVITFGLAFGLGGKDLAKKVLEDLEEKLK